MRSLADLLAALFFVHLAATKCNPRIVKEIKALNLNSENMLDNLHGIYKFAFLSNRGTGTGKRSGPCVKIKFFKEGETSKIEYLNVSNGVYKAELVNGVIVQTGKEGTVDMVAYIVAKGPDVIALHICSEQFENQEPSVTFIAVSDTAESPVKKYEKAKENLIKVGLNTGIEMPGCITGDGGPVGEDNENNMDNDNDENDEDVLGAQGGHDQGY